MWKPGHELEGEQDRDIIRLHEKRITNAIKNNPTEEYIVGDYVRVKMGTLYSSVRKLIKSGDKKNIVVNYSPTVYKVKSILGKDKNNRLIGNRTVSFEKNRYTLENLDGTPLATQQKMNNPDAVRKSKRFFASDFMKVDDPEKETFLKNFSVEDALNLNKMDKRNDIAVARAKPRPAAIVRAILPLPAAQPRPPIVRPAVVAVAVDNSLLGRQIHNTFKGFGRKLFIGKIMSYDDAGKTYKVSYEDGYEQDYSRPEINKYLIQLPSEIVPREQRVRRQVVIGGKIVLL